MLVAVMTSTANECYDLITHLIAQHFLLSALSLLPISLIILRAKTLDAMLPVTDIQHHQ